MNLWAAVRRWVEDRLPWYDPAVEREHRARTEELEQHATRSRGRVAQVRRDYTAMAERLRR